jgi:hypothetical protein
LQRPQRPTGLNKTTVLRAIKTGKISGVRDKNGEWCVEAAELHRVYPSLQRQRAPRMRRSVATIDTEMPARPSSAELGIWDVRKKWQQQTGRPVQKERSPQGLLAVCIKKLSRRAFASRTAAGAFPHRRTGQIAHTENPKSTPRHSVKGEARAVATLRDRIFSSECWFGWRDSHLMLTCATGHPAGGTWRPAVRPQAGRVV